jgi:hypothetical protein
MNEAQLSAAFFIAYTRCYRFVRTAGWPHTGTASMPRVCLGGEHER